MGSGLDSKEIEEWKDNTPKIKSDFDYFDHSYNQSIKDIAALRIYGLELSKEKTIPAAGIPWFVTIFGRDSLITAFQTLILGTELCRGVLETLAAYQGKKIDNYREEEPGKILHEMRFGELAIMQEIPHTPYYGTIDATPLFIILLGEYFDWTGDLNFIEKLLETAEKALNWMDNYGDMDGDGYLEYQRKTDKGLINQGWKDSGNALVFADGKFAEPPIALCEVQGYVYLAKKKLARIYDSLNRSEEAKKLRDEAEKLKLRFNHDFFLEDEQFFAMALDGNKKRVDAITSNAGQLLFSGIVTEKKAEKVKDRLFKEDIYSGWGIRTMSMLNKGYNPISYHNGSVWPHDNSIIAAGLRLYGFYHEAAEICQNMLEASSFFNNFRLPELFCGFEKGDYVFPVEYPTSSSPQAWASGSISLFLTTILGLKPRLSENKVFLKPYLPANMKNLFLRNLKIGPNILDIETSRIGEETDISVDVVSGDIEVIAEPGS